MHDATTQKTDEAVSHRQQTTTIAERQSHQSVLKGIGIINQKFISKTDFFSKLNLYISVCRKTNIFLKWGLGRSPKQGEGGRVDYNIKCNTKKYGHHTHFRVKCNYHKTKGTEVEYEVLYTFYTI